MAAVIIKDIGRHQVKNTEENAVQRLKMQKKLSMKEKKMEEMEVCFLMDRFGYMKLIDKKCL